jgi:PEP-CTERM motif
MMGPLTIRSLRSILASGAALALLGVAPASAVSFTVFWDRADFGFGAGHGVSQTTAQAANAAGIPIVTAPSLLPQPASLVVDHDLIEGSFDPGNPAKLQSDWSATNNTGITDENLFLVYARPIVNEFILEEKDVGLILSFGAGGLDWVILQVPSNPVDPNSIPVYYPAVSLGTLGNGAAANFPLLYRLFDLQVFQGSNLDEVELPPWSLAFFSTTAPIPEPSSGLLMFVGLLGIAGARRKRS